MTWGKGACRYLISQYPEVESKILAELEGLELLKTAQNPKPREMTYADLSKLTYLNAAIKVYHLSYACLLTARFDVSRPLCPSGCPAAGASSFA